MQRLCIGFAALAVLATTAFGQSFPPAWSSTAHYALGDIVQENQNYYRCTHAVTTPTLDPSKAYFNWELWEVRLNTTVLIGTGQTFPTLQAAWAYGQCARISQGAYLHYYLVSTQGAHSETISSGLSLDHPFGASISIIGDSEAKNSLHIPFGSNGITIDSGHALALISNVQLLGDDEAHVALTASDNSLISLSNCNVNGFDNCLHATFGAMLHLSPTVTFTGAGNSPVWRTAVLADFGGRVIMPGVTLDGQNNYWLQTTGIEASEDGYIDAQSCNVSYADTCVEARYMGQVDFTSGSATNGGYGLYATARGSITATYCSFGGASFADIYCRSGAFVLADSYNEAPSVDIGVNDGSAVVEIA